jgi:hypothetical protein
VRLRNTLRSTSSLMPAGMFYVPVNIEGDKADYYRDEYWVKRTHNRPYLLPVFSHQVTATSKSPAPDEGADEGINQKFDDVHSGYPSG